MPLKESTTKYEVPVPQRSEGFHQKSDTHVKGKVPQLTLTENRSSIGSKGKETNQSWSPHLGLRFKCFQVWLLFEALGAFAFVCFLLDSPSHLQMSTWQVSGIDCF